MSINHKIISYLCAHHITSQRIASRYAAPHATRWFGDNKLYRPSICSIIIHATHNLDPSHPVHQFVWLSVSLVFASATARVWFWLFKTIIIIWIWISQQRKRSTHMKRWSTSIDNHWSLTGANASVSVMCVCVRIHRTRKKLQKCPD